MQKQEDYNLDIHMYSLQELLGLFDLTYSITLEDMKRAKKKVLMTHPDKSKLEPKYFLFYKKAFDIVVKFYENQNKQNAKISNEKKNYEVGHQNYDKETTRQVSKNIQSMNKQQFNETFNQLFDNADSIAKKLNIDLNLRPQNLDYQDYYSIAKELENLGS